MIRVVENVGMVQRVCSSVVKIVWVAASMGATVQRGWMTGGEALF